MKIGIVGSRRRNSTEDAIKVKDALMKIIQEGDTLVSGGCKQGADSFAKIIATFYKIPIEEHKPKYWKYGEAATHVRNDLIAKDADVLIACVASNRKGGTEDTIKKFKRYHPDKDVILV